MRADVLCLQEAPRWFGWRARRRRLARDCGMRVVAGGRVGGVAVLAGPAVRVLYARGIRLRWIPGLHWRAIALAVVEKDGERFAVCSAHLDLHGGARLWHAVQLMPLLERTARRYGARAVLGGDMNEHPGDPAWRYVTGRLADCFELGSVPGSGEPVLPGQGAGWTFPARNPVMRIDAIFVAPGAGTVVCGAAEACAEDLLGASDHVPVVADIRPATRA